MIKKLTALLILYTYSAFAGLPPTTTFNQFDTSAKTKFQFQAPNYQLTDLGGIKTRIETGNKNLLKDPGFEMALASTPWTSLGNVDTTSYVEGVQSGKNVYVASSGSISQSVTPPSSMSFSGVNMEASCWVSTTNTTVSVCSLVNGVEQNCSTVPSTGAWQRVASNFIGPAAGTSMGVKVKKTDSVTGSVNHDDCYLGPATNLSQVSQASLVGSAYIANTASCTWSRTNSALGSFGSTAACPGPTVITNDGPGTIQTTDTDLPKFTVNSLPPGTYLVTINGTFAANGRSQVAISDGTTTGPVEGGNLGAATTADTPFSAHLFVTYTTTANKTFELYGAATNTVTVDNGSNMSNHVLSFSIQRFPSSVDQAYRPDATPASWSGTQVGAGGGWSTTSTSYTDFSVATTSNTVTQISSRNISCVAESTKLPAVTCTLPHTGNYLVCAGFSFSGSGGTSATDVRLVDGSGTIINGGQQANATAGGTGYGTTLCGVENVSSLTSATTFKVQGLAAAGQTTTIAQSSNAPVTWSVVQLDAPMAAPYLTGSITSNSTGAERVERAKIAVSGACTTSSESGDWISGNPTYVATGECDITLNSGIFSAAPTCTAVYDGTAARCLMTIQGVSATSVKVYGLNSSTGSGSDCPFHLICMGPR